MICLTFISMPEKRLPVTSSCPIRPCFEAAAAPRSLRPMARPWAHVLWTAWLRPSGTTWLRRVAAVWLLGWLRHYGIAQVPQQAWHPLQALPQRSGTGSVTALDSRPSLASVLRSGAGWVPARASHPSLDSPLLNGRVSARQLGRGLVQARLQHAGLSLVVAQAWRQGRALAQRTDQAWGLARAWPLVAAFWPRFGIASAAALESVQTWLMGRMPQGGLAKQPARRLDRALCLALAQRLSVRLAPVPGAVSRKPCQHALLQAWVWLTDWARPWAKVPPLRKRACASLVHAGAVWLDRQELGSTPSRRIDRMGA